MKQKKYLFLALASVALMACSNDEVISRNTGSTGNDIILFGAGIGMDVVTRAATDVQSTAFAAGEKVVVFMSEHVTTGTATTTYPQPLIYTTTLTSCTDNTTATVDYYKFNDSASDGINTVTPMWPTSGNGIDIYAYYPSGAVTASTATGVSFTVKDDQSADAVTSSVSNYKLSDLMYAKRENQARVTTRVPLLFTHLLSKVTITLTGDQSLNPDHAGWASGASAADRAAAQAAANAKLASATISLKNIQKTVTFDAKDEKNATNLFGTLGTGATGDIVVEDVPATISAAAADLQGSAIFPPQTLTVTTDFIEIQLSAAQGSGKLVYKIPAGGMTFESGKNYSFAITVKLTGLSVSATITDWDTVVGDSNGEATM